MLENIKNDEIFIKNLSGTDKTSIQLVIDIDSTGKEEKLLQIKVGKRKSTIKFEEILSAIFLMSNDEQQEALMPTTLNTVRHINTNVTIKLKSNQKAGDLVTFPYRVKVPAELFVNKGKSGFIPEINDLI